MKEDKAKNTFRKEERLCHQKAITQLFEKGGSFISYPLRVVYMFEESEEENEVCQVLMSVSKRKFKRANKRNRVKRLLREAYRSNKHALTSLLNRKDKHLNIAFLYLKNELPTYDEIEKAILKVNTKLIEKLNEGDKTNTD